MIEFLTETKDLFFDLVDSGYNFCEIVLDSDIGLWYTVRMEEIPYERQRALDSPHPRA
jgi:hypothetical protein